MMTDNVNETVRCPFCDEKISRFAKVCRYCNRTIDPALRELEQFNRNTNSSPDPVTIKINAGVPCIQNHIVNDVPLSRLTYILLALFLGGLGVHNFYAGYTGRGVAQLLITILLWWLVIPIIAVAIWCIIEMIVVKTDAAGRRMI